MQDWEITKTFKSLAEMRASGYGNYIPDCIQPILDRWMKDTEYVPVTKSRDLELMPVMRLAVNEAGEEVEQPVINPETGEAVKAWVVLQEFVPIPKDLR